MTSFFLPDSNYDMPSLKERTFILDAEKGKKEEMKQFITIGLLLGLLLALLSACETVSTNSASTASPSDSNHITSPQKVPTPIIITSSSNISTAQAANPVHISITDAAITSSLRTFSPQQTYTFIVANQSHYAQNFIIVPRPPHSQPVEGSLLILPSTHLSPGATVNFTYKFPSSTIYQNLEFTNHLEGSSGSGLQLPINVK
jgi:hypothetical protein